MSKRPKTVFITLTNERHNTEARLKVKPAGGFFTVDQIKKAKKTLCIEPGCKKCGLMGESGVQVIEIRQIQCKFVHYMFKKEED